MNFWGGINNDAGISDYSDRDGSGVHVGTVVSNSVRSGSFRGEANPYPELISPGFKWTDEETQGAIAALNAAGVASKFYVEYMGTKWTFDKQYFEQLHDTYKLKFRTIHFDLIIATDDDAFNFLLNYRDDVFGKVPVVFCGVNWFNQERSKAARFTLA